MDINLVRSNLGRVKIYYLKNESNRALQAAITALREAIKTTNLPNDVKTTIREVVGSFMKDEYVKKFFPANYIYNPGSEKQLLVYLINSYKSLVESAGKETREETLARKNQLDKNINIGLKLLEQNKFSEADAAFAEAIKFYKNEHRIFQVIALALLNSGQYVRAIPYVKKGKELEPNNETINKLLLQIQQLRQSESTE